MRPSRLFLLPVRLWYRQSTRWREDQGENFTKGFRYASTVSQSAGDLSKTRNIGIIAHIDAGKTTTTERMLYFSGHTRRIGDVDEGSTVTDFLPAERERGVTIQSAAISFNWPPTQEDSAPPYPKTANVTSHNINLIDTPGHADFTFEVLRSLRILDGAVCILDGVAGVEAQTEKVWLQANNYRIPKIVYVNKLDREGASFASSVRQIASKLYVHPALCQIPWWSGVNKAFCGVGDPIGLRAVRWSGQDGTNVEILNLEQLRDTDESFHDEVIKARRALVELLAENEEQMLEDLVHAEEDPLRISSDALWQSLRKCVLDPNSSLVPVFAGASFQNVGVQTLLDAIIKLLPNPSEVSEAEVSVSGVQGALSELLAGRILAPQHSSSLKKKALKHLSQNAVMIAKLETCALAFKVVHDPRHGALVYVRVYSGTLHRSASLFNTNLQLSEKAPWLLKMYASNSVQVDSIPTGQIGVIPGLKYTKTGDTLISYKGADPRIGPPSPINTIQLRPIEVPPAMFSASIEPHNVGEQRSVLAGLEVLTREDPSLQVKEDEETGQTLLSGMGEFHLEIAVDRLVNDMKAKASMGRIEIAYREAITQAADPQLYEFEHNQSGKPEKISCSVSITPLEEYDSDNADPINSYTVIEDGNRISIGFIKADDSSLKSATARDIPTPGSNPEISSIFNAVKNGVMAALGRGIRYSFQMHDTHVIIALDPTQLLSNAESKLSTLSQAAKSATKDSLRRAYRNHEPAILELIMDVTVDTDEDSLGTVANDLSSTRGGHVLSLDDEAEAAQSSEVENNALPGSAGSPQRRPSIDLDQVYVPPDPYGISDSLHGAITTGEVTGKRTIRAKVPLKEMIGYLKYLRSLTAGRGSFTMAPYRFERVVGQREKNLIKELRGG